jgi:hypothetical protein
MVGLIWALIVTVLEFAGFQCDWVKEEINSKPRSDVM